MVLIRRIGPYSLTELHKRALVVRLLCRAAPTTREDPMGQHHPSTPAQRLQWTSYLLAHQGEHGVVAALSRQIGVSRPTLYAWRARAEQALLAVLAPPPPLPPVAPLLERQVLTLYVQAHASTRGIQACLATLTQQGISLDTITRILQDAEQRALHAVAQRQARLERQLATLTGRTAVVARQAARVAAGQPPKGRNPQTDVAAHAAQVAQATQVVADVRYLMQEVKRLLEVVVVDRRGVLDAPQRQGGVGAGAGG